MCSKRIRRRDLIKGLSLATGAFSLGGHTPFKQWVVYRKKHLLISCHRADPRTYDLAREVVAVLEEHLPAAQARPARAPTAGRLLASLIGTDQMDVAILSAEDTAAMRAGTGPFAPYGPHPPAHPNPGSGPPADRPRPFPRPPTPGRSPTPSPAAT